MGGTGSDQGPGIAVDQAGRVQLTGLTSFSDFPITPDAFDTTFNGSFDVFVTFDGRGDVGWTVQFGTAGFDSSRGIALDDEHAVFVGGGAGGPLLGQDFSGGIVDGYVLQLLLDEDDDDDDEDD